MLDKLTDILSGLKNYVFKDKKIEKLAKERAEICAGCYLNDNGICSKKKQKRAVKSFIYNGNTRVKGRYYNGCGCALEVKVRSNTPTNVCPTGEWDYVNFDNETV